MSHVIRHLLSPQSKYVAVFPEVCDGPVRVTMRLTRRQDASGEFFERDDRVHDQVCIHVCFRLRAHGQTEFVENAEDVGGPVPLTLDWRGVRIVEGAVLKCRNVAEQWHVRDGRVD